MQRVAQKSESCTAENGATLSRFSRARLSDTPGYTPSARTFSAFPGLPSARPPKRYLIRHHLWPSLLTSKYSPFLSKNFQFFSGFSLDSEDLWMFLDISEQ